LCRDDKNFWLIVVDHRRTPKVRPLYRGISERKKPALRGRGKKGLSEGGKEEEEAQSSIKLTQHKGVMFSPKPKREWRMGKQGGGHEMLTSGGKEKRRKQLSLKKWGG